MPECRERMQRLIRWIRQKMHLLLARLGRASPAEPSPILLLNYTPPVIPEPAVDPVVIDDPPPPIASVKRVLRTLQREQAGERGEYYFRENILDQLDRYMKYVKRMRRGDLETYQLYAKLGAAIGPRHLVYDAETLSPWFRSTLPSFGAVAIAIDSSYDEKENESKKLYPRFSYFRKLSQPSSDVQQVNAGTVYKVTAYFDDLTDRYTKGHGIPYEFPVVIDPAGEVHVLRMLINEKQIIKHRHGQWRGEATTVSHQRWGIPEAYLEWARDNGLDPHTMLRKSFIAAGNLWEGMNSSMIRVAATRGNLTACFGVDVTRTPYFFKDREVTINKDGKKQRIFHIRRGHERVLKNGRSTMVKMAFPGVRDFIWNGYKIHITVPGRHHVDIAQLDMHAIDEEYVTDFSTTMDTQEFGNILSEHVSTENWDLPSIMEKHRAQQRRDHHA